MVEYLPFKTSLISSFKATGYAEPGDLHLNVFCPPSAGPNNEPLPVMVWIHGGGFYIGGASQFDPSALVAMENVIVVTINYRLGAGGFLPEFETNNGIRDQIVALEWVQENIGDFGGDSSNVTIFGESAGGMSVDTLVHSPKAKSLFARAIGQSGSLVGCFAPADINRANDAYRSALKIGPSDSISGALQALPLKRALNLESRLFGAGPYGPVVDGDILPCLPDNMTPDQLRSVPYMIGRCSGEGDALLTATIPIFLKAGLLQGFSRDIFDMVVIGCFDRMAPHLLEQGDEYLERIIETYRPTSKEDAYFYSEIFCKWWGDLFLGLGPVFTADRYSQVNETFMYEMIHKSAHSHDPEFSGKLRLKPRWSRCDHCDDTIYMFGVPFLSGKYIQGDITFTEEEINLSRSMMKSWADFARSGTPGWAQYNPQTRIRKLFGVKSEMMSEWEDQDLQTRKQLFTEMYRPHQ